MVLARGKAYTPLHIIERVIKSDSEPILVGRTIPTVVVGRASLTGDPCSTLPKKKRAHTSQNRNLYVVEKTSTARETNSIEALGSVAQW